MINKKEMQQGIKIEREHKKTLAFIKTFYKKNKEFPSMEEVAKHIVIDHESEEGMQNRYYTALNAMEEYLKKTA